MSCKISWHVIKGCVNGCFWMLVGKARVFTQPAFEIIENHLYGIHIRGIRRQKVNNSPSLSDAVNEVSIDVDRTVVQNNNAARLLQTQFPKVGQQTLLKCHKEKI